MFNLINYLYSLQKKLLQCFQCLSTLFPFCIRLGCFRGRWTRSKQINIRNCFISHSILQRTTIRRRSFHPFAKWKRLQRFAYHLRLMLYFVWFVLIQITVLLQHICLPLFIFLILFLLLLHPPPPSLCRLRRWSQFVVITTSISSNKFKFRRWIKGNIGIS